MTHSLSILLILSLILLPGLWCHQNAKELPPCGFQGLWQSLLAVETTKRLLSKNKKTIFLSNKSHNTLGWQIHEDFHFVCASFVKISEWPGRRSLVWSYALASFKHLCSLLFLTLSLDPQNCIITQSHTKTIYSIKTLIPAIKLEFTITFSWSPFIPVFILESAKLTFFCLHIIT